MPTKYEACLTEFREAAAAVRHAHGADSEAREAKILADHVVEGTATKLKAAQDRFVAAEAALTSARKDDPNALQPVVETRADGRKLIIDETAQETVSKTPAPPAPAGQPANMFFRASTGANGGGDPS